jgi:hypothetical protein
MLRISADRSQVDLLYGLNAQKSLLFSAIRLDSHPLVAPLIATRDNEQHLLIRQQEQGNALSAGVPMDKIKFYAPWVTIDPRPLADTPVADTLTSLVTELADGQQVTLAADVVYGHYRALSMRMEVTVEDQAPTPVQAYEIRTDEVLARFAAWREAGVRTATRLIRDVSHLAGLEDELSSDKDRRYSALQDEPAGRSRDIVAARFRASDPPCAGGLFQHHRYPPWAFRIHRRSSQRTVPRATDRGRGGMDQRRAGT